MSNRIERHSIKTFRNNNLGIIKLDKLAYPSNDKMKIMVGNKQIFPIGFDTYGHPIISETNFAYYKAQKTNVERRGESLVPIVEYEDTPFCIKRGMYDFTPKKLIYTSEEEGNVYSPEQSSIEEIKDWDLKILKQILNNRKKAAFCGKELYDFLLFKQYLLSSNGKVYACANKTYKEDIARVDLKVETSELKEVHLPGPQDKCDICGKPFTIEDIKNFEISENEKCLKVHKKCLCDYTEAIEYERASQIIDSVYDGKPKSEIVKDYDEKREKKVTWYVYKTNQGTIAIRFKTKVIVIKWHDNFKPFNMKIFAVERVTKFERGIHAWSKDDAIRYLGIAKKA